MLPIFHAAQPIPSGDLVYEISYAGVEGPPATFLHDLCEEAPCPVPAGHFVLTHTELLPTVTPPVSHAIPNIFTLFIMLLHFYIYISPY